MDSTMDDSSFERSPLKTLNNEKGTKKNAIEQIYQKKSQLEHILLRPDTYIGSVEKESQQMWVYDNEKGMVQRDVSFVPGLYKIFDEILVNAADNKIRDPKMNKIKIEINSEQNKISIYNNGRGIPVTMHKEEKMHVPTMIFGHLLTSSNYDDNEKKVVGGRNGYGAKLCNIFSTRFQVETSSKEYRQSFSQVWRDNMKIAEEPVISSTKKDEEDFTRITFSPDLKKFNMTSLDKDIVDLFSRRAYDIAGSSHGVKVYLNGEILPVRGFRNYIDLFLKDKEDEDHEPLKIAHEVVSDRWEIAVTLSEKGFQQNSFVNSIATTRGGKHVDYVADQVVTKLIEAVKKKNNKSAVKPFQVKSHLWVFVNCLIENPTFDSQTKETMTLQTKNFGSKCVPSEKFFTSLLKVGVVESILTWIKFKEQTQLEKTCSSKKVSTIKGIPKLDDANDAGTKNSLDCTLILTEGDSAKSFAVAGLGVVGRDKYGVFPLRGKMLNVREATHKQIMENVEINNLVKILGLQYKKKYTSNDDLKCLRYGRLMIMTDQDQDGSHIKGLLINFIHYNWPSLIKLNFIEEFITPIVKATKGETKISFYSLPEFEEWKQATRNYNTYKIKYYKGLGTSTSNEAKEYFVDMKRHRIKFRYEDPEDDKAVELAFSKKMIEARKDWLTQGMEERRRRRELGLNEIYLYESNTSAISYKDFINKELILFSNMDNERSIPSLVDGLKPGQRKVVFVCFKRNLYKNEVKVAQLAGSVSENSSYHHGEVSLMSTIINLAQNFVGSNNINLLQPNGQFGSRLQGGKDAASPRYIFTLLSPLARKLFPSMDDCLLNYLYDDNKKIEPEYYVPIIPTVLVNGAEGIGTGWSTRVPNYNPRDIVANIKKLLNDEEMVPLEPWYKGFRGSIVKVDSQKYVISGEVAVIDDKSIEITELPIRTWTQAYKETVIESLLGNDKNNNNNNNLITDCKEYHTDTTVRFLIHLPENNLKKMLDAGIHKEFKLQTQMSLSSMVLFDHNGVLRKYNCVMDIMKEFFSVRLKFYIKRKAYYEGIIQAEVLKLENQARFILEKNNKKIIMENIKKKDFINILIERKYDSDPVKAWKAKNKIEEENDEAHDEGETETTPQSDEEKKYDFDYLVDMTMRNMLLENVQELLKKRDTKKQELEELKIMTPKMLWERDLDSFLEELDRVEQKEIDDASKAVICNVKSKGKNKGKTNTKNEKKTDPKDCKPSENADRIEPKIDFGKYQPKEKKERKKKEGDEKKSDKGKKKGNKDNDESQMKITSLITAATAVATTSSANDKTSDDEVKLISKPKQKLKLKQTTLNFKPTKREVIDVSESEDTDKSKKQKETNAKKDKLKYDDDEEDRFAPKKKVKKTKANISSDSEESVIDISENEGLAKPKKQKETKAKKNNEKRKSDDYDEDSFAPKKKVKKTKPKISESEESVVDISENEGSAKPKKQKKNSKKTKNKVLSDTDASDNTLSDDSEEEEVAYSSQPKQLRQRKQINYKNVIDSDSDSIEDDLIDF